MVDSSEQVNETHMRSTYCDGPHAGWGGVFRKIPAFMLTLALLTGAFLLPAQSPQNDQLSAPSSPPVNRGGMDGNHVKDASTISPQMQEQIADRRNSDRQKQLMADTEKLFQLAQQLRDEVAKSNKDQLSIPVVKKSEEIEKLAKSVKEKMRGY